MADAPDRIWLSAPDNDHEAVVWFDPDEGGIPYVRADLVEAMETENQQMKELICWAYDTLKEINPSNYLNDDVCALNDASVEVILGLASIATRASHD